MTKTVDERDDLFVEVRKGVVGHLCRSTSLWVIILFGVWFSSGRVRRICFKPVALHRQIQLYVVEVSILYKYSLCYYYYYYYYCYYEIFNLSPCELRVRSILLAGRFSIWGNSREI